MGAPVLTYNIYVDGVSQPGWLEEGGQAFRDSFKTSSDAKEIVFRPVYSLSGEHLEEKITFSLK